MIFIKCDICLAEIDTSQWNFIKRGDKYTHLFLRPNKFNNVGTLKSKELDQNIKETLVICSDCYEKMKNYFYQKSR